MDGDDSCGMPCEQRIELIGTVVTSRPVHIFSLVRDVRWLFDDKREWGGVFPSNMIGRFED